MTEPMTRVALIKKIRKLPEDAPITAEFERALREPAGGLNDRRWYRTQKEHWLGWLGDYNGPGAYDRQSWEENARAETIYNRVVNPAMVLWLGEAAGVDPPIARQAVSAALPRAPSLPSMAGAIRKVIPWSLVQEQF